MGKLYDSLLSGTSGRTGRIVVANVYGNEITRVRPKKRNSAPTVKQQMIRNRMKRCAEFLQSYRGYACKHFGNRSGMKSCYNLAMTNLMENFSINYEDATITPDYPKIFFSKGNLLAPVPLSATVNGDQVEVRWQNNAAGDPDRENDLGQILLAAEGKNLTTFVENATMRSVGSYAMNIPANFQGKKLHVWLAFRSADGEQASNSQYLEAVS